MTLSTKVRGFLEERRFATLATINPDGTAQQSVMWYELRDGQILMNTARGRQKDRNLLRDRRVSICVEDGYRYVTISGTVALVEDPIQAQADIRDLAIRYEGQAKAERMVRDQFSRQERVTLLLPIERADAHGFGT